MGKKKRQEELSPFSYLGIHSFQKKKKHLSPSDPSAPCLVNQYGETFTDQITPIHSGPKKILTASPTISKAIAFFSHFLSFLPFPFLSHKV